MPGCFGFGERNFEQSYEIGRVVKVNNNCTLDVLIPGRPHPYTELPSLIDPRIHRTGMVVIVGKAHGSPYLPFVLGDTRGYKKTKPSDFVPMLIFLYDWSCARSNPKQNFLSGLYGPAIDILDEDIIPYKLDRRIPASEQKHGQIIGMVRYQEPLVEEGEEFDLIGIKNFPGANFANTSYKDEYFAIYPYENITQENDILFEVRVNDLAGVTGSWYYVNGPSSWFYCTEENVLIAIKYGQLFGFGPRCEVVCIDAVSGSLPGDNSEIGGAIVDAISRTVVTDATLNQGATICGNRFVKTYHNHSYVHNSLSETTTGSTGTSFVTNDHKIICYRIPNMSVIWSFNPDTIWNGTDTIPYLREIVPLCLSSGSGDIDQYKYGQSILNPGVISWPGVGNAFMLPGNPGVFCEISKILVLPIVGREACSSATYSYTNSNYPTVDFRTRYSQLGQEYNYSGKQLGASFATAQAGPPWGFCFFRQYVGSSGSSTNSNITFMGKNPAPGGGTFPTGAFQINAGKPCSKKLNNFLVALDMDESSENYGKVKWKYEFPELLATDTNNYIVDHDSFSKVSNWRPNVIDKAIEENTYSVPQSGGFIIARNISFSFSSSVFSPDQFYLSSLSGTPSVPPVSIPASSESYTMGTTGSFFEEYMYWPQSATYYWDPMPIMQAGDGVGSGVNTFPTHSNIVADNADNIYGVYLKPFIIVSCASVLHNNDESITDRTHTGITFNPEFSDYGPDRLTPKADNINVYGIANNNCVIVPGTSMTDNLNITIYGYPYKHVMFKSFLAKWDNQGNLLQNKELTVYMNERLDNSSSLDGQLPYPGCTLRIIPSSAGLFVFRLERLPIQTSLREYAYFPYFHAQKTSGGSVYSESPGNSRSNLLNSKAIVELRDINTLEVIWSKTIFDPTSAAPIWCCGASMFASETASAGNPWVIGRVDYSKDYDAKTRWMDDPADYGAGLARFSKIFTIEHINDEEPILKIRDAKYNDEDGNIDLGSNGIWPHDYINPISYNNGLCRLDTPLLMEGTMHYPALRYNETDKYDVYAYGNDIPPI